MTIGEISILVGMILIAVAACIIGMSGPASMALFLLGLLAIGFAAARHVERV